MHMITNHIRVIDDPKYEVGVTQGGCNPWPIEGVSVGKTEITIPAASLDAMRDTFTFWGGPSE